MTVTAETTPGAPNNRLQALRLGATTNALVDVGGRTYGNRQVTIPLDGRSQQATFLVRRAQAGLATTVPLVVVDGCGDWPTSVGGGAGAF